MNRLTRAIPSLLLVIVVAGCSFPETERAVAEGPTTRPPAALASPPAVLETMPPAATPGPTAPPATQAASPTVTAAPETPARETPARETPAPEPASGEPFAMNLFRSGDFVRQYTFEWCVGASLQMMRNLTDAKVTTARSTQQRWWELARDLSSSPFGGANPRGWTAALNELGVGPYELVSIPDYDEALRVAAAAIRETDRPVGLVMWRGRHAWVMSGFEASGDPRTDPDFEVTGVRVLDPLYPHGNSTWGPSPKPNALLTPARLGRQFVSRDRFRVNLGVPPGHLLVLPVAAENEG